MPNARTENLIPGHMRRREPFVFIQMPDGRVIAAQRVERPDVYEFRGRWASMEDARHMAANPEHPTQPADA